VALYLFKCPDDCPLPIYKKLINEFGKKPGMNGTYVFDGVVTNKPRNDRVFHTQNIKPANNLNSEITFDDFSFAFFDETKDLSEENKQKLLEMARFFKQEQDKDKK
jgi:hypothetical protein